MIEIRSAEVAEVVRDNGVVEELLLTIDHPEKKAVNYVRITGKVHPGDKVWVNTTACSLGLGTGGYHFVMANLSLQKKELTQGGHGMKMKYTPIQSKVLLAEEPDSPHHHLFSQPIKYDGRMIFIGELHSMLPPLCAYLKYHSGERIRIAYIMTDHGALPISFSRNVEMLQKNKLLDATITAGNAFGGEYECVNVYTAMQAAIHGEDCQAVIITMGPGILGTDTQYGFSGLELGLYADMIFRQGGRCIYVPRLGQGDSRERHVGISHHTLTVLRDILHAPLPVILPLTSRRYSKQFIGQLKASGIWGKHPVVFRDGGGMEKALEHYNLSPRTMGRGIREEPQFFNGLGAAANYGLAVIDKERERMV